MPFYGSVSDAASLAGVAETTITEAVQSWINQYIDTMIRDEGFGATAEVTEYHDIRKSGQVELVLNNMPITAVSSVVDNAQADSPTTLSTANYVVDLAAGIIQLISPQSGYSATDTYVYQFTPGFNTVKVVYTYGYASVPNDIKQLATQLAAKWAEISEQQADADGLRQVKIGDYQETRDHNFMNVRSKYDDMINMLLKRLQAKYNQGV